MSVSIRVDNRYESSPTVLKIVVMVLAVISVIVALIALAQLDRILGYHRRIGRAPVPGGTRSSRGPPTWSSPPSC